ncbi:unnamed protein product [Blepharisma stoltei]|uniref:Eukaryotic translation initiation factor 3 30 kDa subunit n=1 Tax=Blepharisma stoltei TaxID=1481888 RepID=A0AAU9JPI6_9CILI|nr:unnamed protein product [Blepharisma stoltei]
MSEEDWEGLAEKDEDEIQKILDSQNKFSDEFTAPVVSEPPAPTAQEQSAPKAVKKNKKKIGEEFEKKNQEKKRETQGKTPDFDEKRAQKQKEEKADHELTDELFQVTKVEELISEQNYLDFAGEVSRKLTHGNAHYRIPIFFKELLKDMSTLLDSTQLSEIVSQTNIAHADKVKQEKGPTKKKATKKQPVIKGIDKKGNLFGDEEEGYDEKLDEYADIF